MTPSPEGWPTKAKEAPSPHEVRLTLLNTNPVFQYLGEEKMVHERAGFSRFFFLFFCPQNWEDGPKMGQNQGFLNLLKNVVINIY